MRTIDADIMAQLQAKTLRPFFTLDLDIEGTHYRYTDCDVPIIGSVEDETGASWGPAYHNLSLAAGQAFFDPYGVNLANYAKGIKYANHLGPNLMTNGDNEAAAASLSGSDAPLKSATIAQSNEQAYEGTYSTKVTLGGTYSYGGWQYIGVLGASVLAGHTYKVSARIYLPSGQALDTIYADCWTDSNGRARYNSFLDFTENHVHTTDAWVEAVNYVRVVDELVFRIYCADTELVNNAGVFYIDDIRVEEVLDDNLYQIELRDSAGKKALGYIQAPDSKEYGNASAGTELITNGTFNENITGWTTTAGHVFDTFEWDGAGALHAISDGSGSSYGNSPVFTVAAGKLYRVAFTLSLTSGTAPQFAICNSDTGGNISVVVQSSNGANVVFLTTTAASAVARFFFYLSNGEAGNFTLDNVSVKEINHCGESGVAIVSTATGHVQDWASIESGFNYNDSSYTFDVLLGHFVPRKVKLDPIRYSMGRNVDSMEIQIDNLDDALTPAFVGGTPQGSTVTLSMVVLDANYKIIATPVTLFKGIIDGWDMDEEKITLTVASELVRWNQKTLAKHSASCRWKEFKGAECAYAGAEGWCDRSFTRCTQLGNASNFGGFRWLPSIVDKEIWWGRSRVG